MHHPPPHRRRASRVVLALLVSSAALLAGTTAVATPAEAADRGTGFGTWAPLSSTGWHGSM
ncbi:hypothetical protein, partial [Escherichia coli]|uniref:hypothetical protein n=2 Tax=Bacteria TaxID=2 RepID=UPI0039E0F682